jgi:predicted alpha/beta superfamily hydrolase
VGGGVIRASLAAWAFVAAGVVRAAIVVPVEVDMSAEVASGRFDAARDGVGIRGSQPPLSWGEPLLLQPRGNGRWGAELRFDSVPFGGQPVQYKFRIEKPGQSGDANWEQGPNRLLALDAPAPRITRAFDAPPDGLALRRTGTIERLGRIASLHVAPRDVQVWLPPGYEREPTRRYPVLYLHDGQNVFDAAGAGAEWQVDETAQRLVEAGAIAPPIIVAIASGPNRARDYTPTLGRIDGQPAGGGLADYGRFTVEELKPQIDRRFRTQPGREHTAVGGSSFGGIASLWLALHRADVFGAALVVSPSLWWDDGFALRDVQGWRGSQHAKLWLDMGGREGAGIFEHTRRLQQALWARGWSAATLAYTEAPEGSHDEASWAARVEGMLKFLYPVDSRR